MSERGPISFKVTPVETGLPAALGSDLPPATAESSLPSLRPAVPDYSTPMSEPGVLGPSTEPGSTLYSGRRARRVVAAGAAIGVGIILAACGPIADSDAPRKSGKATPIETLKTTVKPK